MLAVSPWAMNSAKTDLNKQAWLTASFYRFVSLDDCPALRDRLQQQCEQRAITGTILLAREGINATICGDAASVREFIAQLDNDPRLQGMEIKESTSDQRTLARLKVKIKPEIITMNQPDLNPAAGAGEYVDPEQWNALISDPDVVVIDTRNDYEVAIGQFAGARNPGTANFSDLPAWLDKQDDLRSKPAVAMYCTGGIRCEKSTALLRKRGFERVYHLRGGILNYLAQIKRQDSLWQGECFVFDERVSVDHELKPGRYEPCGACGHPIDENDRQSGAFVQNMSCPYCLDKPPTSGQ